MKLLATSDDYKEHAGTPEQEQLVATEAIKKFRIARYEAFRKEQYHNNYLRFYNERQEKRILKPEDITLHRHEKFDRYCKDVVQEGYVEFKGTDAEENEAVATAILNFRKQNESNTRLQNYWKKVNEKPTIKYKTYTTDEFYKYITEERAVQIFGVHKTGPNEGKPKFKEDDQAKAIIRPLCEYFTDNPAFEKRCFEDPETKEKTFFSLDKGIMLFSECGFGKTDTMRLFTANPKQSLMVVNCLTVVEDFNVDGDDAIRKYYGNPKNQNPQLFFGHTHFGVCFDNFGLELDGKYFGDTVNVMEKVLFQRYHRQQELEGKTHLTTNFGREYIKNRYGPAVYSRFFGMFNFLTFPAGSVDRRKVTAK